MRAFRLLLVAMLVFIIGYTAVTISNHGWNLLMVFFGDIAAMGWPGQFNSDFLCFLLLSGLWVAWRHHFRPAGLLLAPVAINGGILFLSIYLLIVSGRPGADMASVLLGPERARRR